MRIVTQKEFEAAPKGTIGSCFNQDTVTKNSITLVGQGNETDPRNTRTTMFDFNYVIDGVPVPFNNSSLVNLRAGWVDAFRKFRLGEHDALSIAGIPGLNYAALMSIPKTWIKDGPLCVLWDEEDLKQIETICLNYFDSHIEAQKPLPSENASLYQWWGHYNEYLTVAMTEEQAREQIDNSMTASITQSYREEWAGIRTQAADRVIKFGDSWINPRYQ